MNECTVQKRWLCYCIIFNWFRLFILSSTDFVWPNFSECSWLFCFETYKKCICIYWFLIFSHKPLYHCSLYSLWSSQTHTHTSISGLTISDDCFCTLSNVFEARLGWFFANVFGNCKISFTTKHFVFNLLSLWYNLAWQEVRVKWYAFVFFSHDKIYGFQCVRWKESLYLTNKIIMFT